MPLLLINNRFSWIPTDFGKSDQYNNIIPEASSLNIRLLAYDPQGNKTALADRSDKQWIDAGVIMDRIQNNGKATLDITYENLIHRLNISDKLLKKTFVVFRADVVEPQYAAFDV